MWRYLLKLFPYCLAGYALGLFFIHYWLAVVAVGCALAPSSRYRRWLARQPGYIFFLSRLPGWRPPRASLLFLTTPVYSFFLHVCFKFFLESLPRFYGHKPDDGLELIYSRPAYLLGLGGAFVLYLCVTGRWIFAGQLARFANARAASLGGKRRARSTDELEDEERGWSLAFQLGWRSYYSLTSMAASLRVTTKTLYPIWFFVAAVICAPIFAALCYYGVLLAFAGAALALWPRSYCWLTQQPGYVNRLSRLRGWRPVTRARLAVASLLYLAPPSVLFWYLAYFCTGGTFCLAGSDGYISWDLAAVGLFGVGLLYGFLIRNWHLFFFADWQWARSLDPRWKRWQRLDERFDALSHLGRYAEALEASRLSRRTARRLFGSYSRPYATALHKLGLVRLQRGDFTGARPLLERSLRLRGYLVGETHHEYAAGLYLLGRLHFSVGDYAAAESSLRRALLLLRAGANNFEYCQCLNDLGLVYLSVGDYRFARLCFKTALDTRLRWGVLHEPVVEESVRNLGRLYAETGEAERAREFYGRALTISIAVWGGDHPRYAATLAEVASFLSSEGDDSGAGWLLERVGAIERRALGDKHPSVAHLLTRLAELHRRRGERNVAEALFREALGIFEAAGLNSHPPYASALHGLAELLAASGRVDKALSLTMQAVAVDDATLEQVFAINSEADRISYLAAHKETLDRCLAFVRNYCPGSPRARLCAFELLLRRKGVVTEAAARQRSGALGGQDPKVARLLKEMIGLDFQIARRAIAGHGDEGRLVHERLLAEWRARRNRLDAELGRRLPGSESRWRPQEVSCEMIAAALPEDSVLVEFVSYAEYEDGIGPAAACPAARLHYLAFVLPARLPEQVSLVDLGEAGRIDELIESFRASITGEPDGAGTRNLVPPEADFAAYASQTAGEVLRAKLFEPLVGALRGRTHVLLSPDGNLCLLPFGTLPDAGGGYLIDRFHFTYLCAGRDLLRQQTESAAGPPFVLADPNFDLASTSGATSRENAESRPGAGGLRSSAITFPRLAGTHDEGRAVADMLDVTPALYNDALKQRVTALRSPAILHLATHGFFLPATGNGTQRVHYDFSGRAGVYGTGFERLARQENPLLRSGLALAGANTWLHGDALPESAGDGILNAVDVSGLDLSGTRLVVLSACETGLGDVSTGEGVYGLRRAFMVVGARTLIMSLWKVPDHHTRELMLSFYRHFLSGQKPARALLKAQLEIKSRHAHPLFWGGFICQGDAETNGPFPSPSHR
jgi:CHAT domain-containing protein/tetratricopeptide (TPR) repeat protein